MTDHASRHDGAPRRRPAQIMAEINRTRAEMDETLHAIEDRLTPGQLVDQGLDYLRHSGAREYVSNLGTSVKTNPLPATLAGIGLAWLMATSGRTQQPPASQSTAPGVGERMQGVKDSVSGTVQSTRESLSSGMQSARESMSSGMQSARERASQLADTTRMQMDRARGQWDYMIREHPLALGAIGLAIGAMAAAMAPRTRAEDEMMGEARDRLAGRARETAGQKLEQAKQAAGAAKETVKETVKQEQKPGADARPQGPQRAQAAQGPQAQPPQARPVRGDTGTPGGGSGPRRTS